MITIDELKFKLGGLETAVNDLRDALSIEASEKRLAELETKYRPYIDQRGIPYLERGTRWQYQMHIYETPFYYIDYCLAQTAAFQFLLASQTDYADAFARYLHLSQQGGEKLWTELLTEAGFRSPFEPGALAQLAAQVEPLIRRQNI
mgnify:CR=1 FL=1